MKKLRTPSLILCILMLSVCSESSDSAYYSNINYGDFTGYELNSRNIILIIGDGMGYEQVKATSYFNNGEENSLSFSTFPYQSEMTTYSKSSSITDSAASGTAMATGNKVNNDVISCTIPGTGDPLITILELASISGRSTALVTTTYITHATPAAFASHVRSRDHDESIALQYMNESKPDILLGGGSSSLSTSRARENGYTIVESKAELEATTELNQLLGYFGEGHMPYMYDGIGNLPELSDMAVKALDILEEDEDGFFLMIEGGRIDHAGHENDLVRLIYETLELSDTVEKVLQWADGREDTTIIVTADHETGGLSVTGNNGAGQIPDHTWSTHGHSAAPVPVYLWGEHAQTLSETINDNTDIYQTLVTEPN